MKADIWSEGQKLVTGQLCFLLKAEALVTASTCRQKESLQARGALSFVKGCQALLRVWKDSAVLLVPYVS